MDAARKSIVLLTNDGILPLREDATEKILITGPNANDYSILGDWSLEQDRKLIKTIQESIITKVGSRGTFQEITEYIDISDEQIEESCHLAEEPDLPVLSIGGNSIRSSTQSTCG